MKGRGQKVGGTEKEVKGVQEEAVDMACAQLSGLSKRHTGDLPKG